MTISDVIAIAGQIAMWITLIVVFLTLREMEKQRRASYKPELVIPRSLVYGFGDIIVEDIILPLEWRNSENIEETRDDSLLTIYNLGFGAAVHIRISWEFEFEETLRFVQDYCYENSIPIVVGYEQRFGTKVFQLEIEDRVSSFINIGSIYDQSYDYLVPASVTSKGLRLHLPPDYKSLIAIMIFMSWKEFEKDNSPMKDLNFPDLKLKVNYQDIGGNDYVKEFGLTFQLRHMTNKKETDESVFSALLELNRK